MEGLQAARAAALPQHHCMPHPHRPPTTPCSLMRGRGIWAGCHDIHACPAQLLHLRCAGCGPRLPAASHRVCGAAGPGHAAPGAGALRLLALAQVRLPALAQVQRRPRQRSSPVQHTLCEPRRLAAFAAAGPAARPCTTVILSSCTALLARPCWEMRWQTRRGRRWRPRLDMPTAARPQVWGAACWRRRSSSLRCLAEDAFKGAMRPGLHTAPSLAYPRRRPPVRGRVSGLAGLHAQGARAAAAPPRRQGRRAGALHRSLPVQLRPAATPGQVSGLAWTQCCQALCRCMPRQPTPALSAPPCAPRSTRLPV